MNSDLRRNDGRRWPALPYAEWSATRDTLHAHTQVLGKLAVALAPQERQLEHTALHITARGWETALLPAPDGSGAFVTALDLHKHEAVVEHSDGRSARIALTPNRSVAEVTRAVLGAVRSLAGPVAINTRPQEVPWDVPLDEDDQHSTYDPTQVATYFAAATRAALVLGALRAPFAGRSTPVNAWWGAFDLSATFFNGKAMDPPSNNFIMRNASNAEQISVGWWPGDARYERAAFFAYAAPAPEGYWEANLSPAAAHWEPALGEFVLDWDDVVSDTEPFRAALDFGRSAVASSCEMCGWDPVLAQSVLGIPPPVS